MKVEEYYEYQGTARGLRTVEDVMAALKVKARLYDRLIRDWLPDKRDAAIYEVACGPGIFLHWLRSHQYHNATGSDSSKKEIDLAKAGNLPVKLADSLAELRAMPPESYDCIIGFDFYEHLPKDVMLDFLGECQRVLRPKGILLLRGPNGDSPVIGRSLFNDITHQWAVTSTAFRALLEMVGFRQIEFRDDALASIEQKRILKLPFAWMAQQILRALLRSATREDIRCLSASFFIRAVK